MPAASAAAMKTSSTTSRAYQSIADHADDRRDDQDFLREQLELAARPLGPAQLVG